MREIDQLNKNLEAWCARQGIFGIGFCAGLDYQYGIKTHDVYYAVVESEATTQIDLDFEQFFYEYGCEWEVGVGILSLVHEIAHHMTFLSLSEDEIIESDMIKSDPSCSNDAYWHTPVEFIANIWAIDFINQHIDAVAELSEIMNEGFHQIYGSHELDEVVDMLNEIAEMEEDE